MQGRAASHPSWVCGLKPIDYFTSVLPRAVTPFVGVWIETVSGRSALGFQTSHPSWVCGLKQQTFAHAATVQGSHPSWVCGLKLPGKVEMSHYNKSHPSWVCGLKP